MIALKLKLHHGISHKSDLVNLIQPFVLVRTCLEATVFSGQVVVNLMSILKDHIVIYLSPMQWFIFLSLSGQ